MTDQADTRTTARRARWNDGHLLADRRWVGRGSPVNPERADRLTHSEAVGLEILEGEADLEVPQSKVFIIVSCPVVPSGTSNGTVWLDNSGTTVFSSETWASISVPVTFPNMTVSGTSTRTGAWALASGSVVPNMTVSGTVGGGNYPTAVFFNGESWASVAAGLPNIHSSYTKTPLSDPAQNVRSALVRLHRLIEESKSDPHRVLPSPRAISAARSFLMKIHRLGLPLPKGTGRRFWRNTFIR